MSKRSDEDTFVLWTDNALLLLGGFILLFAIALAMVAKPTPEIKDPGIQAPGNVIVEIRWPDGIDADVDLWLLAPGDVPVGYSNQSGHVFNLLRDDLGKVNDPDTLNYETAFSRGIPAGEYVVNLHLFRATPALLPLRVQFVISIKTDSDKSAKRVLIGEQTLIKNGEEVTAVRFTIDSNKALVNGSENHIFRKVRG